ncbi:hypothetical protein [Pelagicoccus sp. SDUM812002]|uniref:hypothetical protein n=1 Tax=Pelagicoccus sp. SDUM812002 TaxID=3041266 RepID=UPI00280F80EA|nr:hypothetical protein [Pelagicoccus sp. SDUM812002]MDQ8186862.1 hypothetical protein [Pelagicoccus sp. SDUM812002]
MLKKIARRGSWRAAWIVLTALVLFGPSLEADTASNEEAAWFAGKWMVGPAPVEGGETIAGGEANVAVVRHLGGPRIEREITLRGQLHVMQFEVRAFGGNFPWWGDNGGNYVSKNKDENTFILVPVGPMGKAEWERAWLYQRLLRKPSSLAEQRLPGFA